jgi:hypothetical protein
MKQTITGKQRIKLSPVKFKNTIYGNDGENEVTIHFIDNNNMYFTNLFDRNIIKTKIVKKPQNKILKRRLSNVDYNEKIIFKFKLYNSGCFYSSYDIYYGEITLNQEKDGYFQLQLFKKNKQTSYIKDYELIDSYVSNI